MTGVYTPVKIALATKYRSLADLPMTHLLLINVIGSTSGGGPAAVSVGRPAGPRLGAAEDRASDK